MAVLCRAPGRRTARSRRDGRETGQATFELISFVIAVVMVTIVCVQGVYVSQAAAAAQQAARDGARAYTLGQSVESAVSDQLPDWVEEEGQPDVTFPTSTSVKVEVTVQVPVMAGSRQMATVTMSRSAEMPTASRSILAARTPGGATGLLAPSTLCALSWAPRMLLRCDAAAALEQVNQLYQTCTGGSISVTDAYRDIETQRYLFRTKPNLAAAPGRSNHGRGTAVDLGGGINSFDTPQYRCMQQSAEGSGWNQPAWARLGGSKEEPWHWEFSR